MSAVLIETLPDQLRSRVLDATAGATHRRIHQFVLSNEAGPVAYAVEAVSEDHVTLMRLALHRDGSIQEATNSFTSTDIVDCDGAAGKLVLRSADGTRKVFVAADTVDAIRAMQA